jgi:hypothetical protein
MPTSGMIAMATIDTASSNVSPIEAATRVHNLVYLAYVTVLVLAAFFTWLAWKTGNRVQDAIRADADARIAEASSKATALENVNLTLRGQVATLETGAANAAKDVARLQKEAADSKAAQQRVELDLATQKTELAKYQERAAIAERSLLEVQQKIADRDLTPVMPALIAALKDGPKCVVNFEVIANDAEAARFAVQIGRALREAGWGEESSTNLTYAAFRPFRGIELFVGPIEHSLPHLVPPTVPPAAEHLLRAFTSAGIEIRPFAKNGGRSDVIELHIGSK